MSYAPTLPFSRFLERTRTAKRLTVQAAAERLGVTKGTYSRWRRQKHLPRMEQVQAIAQWARVKPEEVMRLIAAQNRKMQEARSDAA